MRKEIVASLMVDRCPTCHGVWLDRGELELMKEMIEAGVTSKLVRELVFPAV
jgi:Zn-finger nucleic acid-binding protein